MVLTVLGKYGPYPKADGACSGYLVESGGDYLLLDMGSGVLSRLLSTVDIGKIKHIFISHLHFDHTSDLLPFRYLLEEVGSTVTVYTAYEDSEWYQLLFNHPTIKIINIDENTPIHIGNMALQFVKMCHTKTDYGVMIKADQRTLCYTGDTEYCKGVEQCCEESDCVLADCSKPSGFQASHMTVDDAVRLSEKYRCKIIATHQSADYDPAAFLKDHPTVISAKEMEKYQI